MYTVYVLYTDKRVTTIRSKIYRPRIVNIRHFLKKNKTIRKYQYLYNKL